MNTMAIRIKERRKALRMTQEELAARLGLQKSAIAKYENGRVENIKRSIIKQMSGVLECSPTYLLGFETEQPLPIPSDEEYKLLSDYRSLDSLDKAKVSGFVGALLLDDKYKKDTSSEAI